MKAKRATKYGGVLLQLGPREPQLPIPLLSSEPVFRLQRILVPVDFSERSKKALRYAAAFARHFGASLTLLHVVRHQPVAQEVPNLQLQALQQAGRKLEGLRAGVPPGVPAEAAIREGNPCAQILAAAKELVIDLVILSTRGHTGLARALHSSTAEKIVRRASCPVLIVREDEREFVPDAFSLSAVHN